MGTKKPLLSGAVSPLCEVFLRHRVRSLLASRVSVKTESGAKLNLSLSFL